MPFCACGCGGEIIPQKHHKYYGCPKYIAGHGSRIHNPSQNKSPSAETKQRMRDAKLGTIRSKESIKKQIETRQKTKEKNGYYFSEETKVKQSLAAKGKPKSLEHIKHNSESHIGLQVGEKHPMYGKHHTEESKRKNREAHIGLLSGKNHPFYGKHHTDESRLKNSLAHMGIKKGSPSEETRKKIGENRTYLRGEQHYNYRGGSILYRLRSKSKRRCLGNEPLNTPFDNSHGHHIDKKHIIFIPKWLHEMFRHALKKPESMERINNAVCYWLLIYYLQFKKGGLNAGY